MSTIPGSQQVFRSGDFVQSIGVATHLAATSGPYANVNQVIAELHYLNVDHVRAGVVGIPFLKPLIAVGQAGIKFDLFVNGDPIAAMPALDAMAPYLTSIEGHNEIDRDPITYKGLTGPAAAVLAQKDLYTAVHADTILNGNGHATPVLAFSLAPGANYALYGDISAYADYKNIHAYGQYGCPTYWYMQPGITRAIDTPNLPTIITETGHYTRLLHDSGVNETVQAKLELTILLDALKDGVKATYLYQLSDLPVPPNSTTDEGSWGLFHIDGTPKLAATALHNLTSILADASDTAQSFTTAALSYAVSGLPSSGNQVAFEKSNGVYDIAIWQEPWIWSTTTDTEVLFPTRAITVTLGQVYQTINLYDPLAGTTPIATYHDVSSVQIALGTTALILELEPNAVNRSINTGSAGGAFNSTGNDTITAGSGAATINVSGAATITGSSGPLVVHLAGAHASVSGGAGALTVTSDGGSNTVTGGSGAFSYVDLTATDVITTGLSASNSVMLGSGAATVAVLGRTTLTGGSGNATVTLDGGPSSITGGTGTLTITDAVGGNTISGGGGVLNATIRGSGDVITTGNTSGVSTISFTTGSDTVNVNGATSIIANHANLTVAGNGPLSVNGGTGAITLHGTAGPEYIFTQAGTANTLWLGSGSNTVLSHGADTINASTALGAGPTSIYAAGPASITGGAGLLFVNGRNAAVTVLGGTGAVKASALGDNSYLQGGSLGHNILSAAGGNITLVGGGGGDTLTDTGTGNNLLQAGAGAETLSAGAGGDTLVGGSGADVFVLTAAAAPHSEVIRNFQRGTDQISFAGFGAATPIASQQVVGGNLQLTLADQTQVTLVGITSLV